VRFLLQIFYRSLHQVATTLDFMLIGLYYRETKDFFVHPKEGLKLML
jgi:hypothetical protein